ncbi:MAG: hypothetical protein JW741_01030 [Sedimentisphaerales bacterium]|nr:hypothetical protein [Sedimentisphaerales bacterium]
MPPVRPRDERTDEFGKLCDKLCPEGKEREAFEKRRANESAVAAVRLENEAAKLEAMQKAHLEAIQEREAALRSAGLRHNEGLAALMQAEQETLDARLALEPRIDRRRALRQKYLDRLQTREKEIDKRVASGDGVYAPVDAFTCKAARIAAEIALHCESCSGVRPEEHEILENQVDILYQTYQRIKFLYEFGSDGGDFAAMAVTGHALCRALADLELARGNHAKALAHSRDAARMAATSLRAVQVSYEHGDTTIRSVLEEQSRCLATKLRLLRLKRQVGEASSNIDSATEKGQ